MSKTVRFKLHGDTETYVFSSMYQLKKLGVLPTNVDISSLAKESLLLTLQDLNAKVREELTRRQEEAESGIHGNTKGSNGAGEVSGTVRSDAVENEEDALTSSEGER